MQQKLHDKNLMINFVYIIWIYIITYFIFNFYYKGFIKLYLNRKLPLVITLLNKEKFIIK